MQWRGCKIAVNGCVPSTKRKEWASEWGVSWEGRCERKEWKVLCEQLTPSEAASYSLKVVLIHQGTRCNGGSACQPIGTKQNEALFWTFGVRIYVFCLSSASWFTEKQWNFVKLSLDFDFLGGSVAKNLPGNARDVGSISGWARALGSQKSWTLCSGWITTQYSWTCESEIWSWRVCIFFCTMCG